MRKALSIILSIIIFAFCLVSCSKADNSLWQSNETFEKISVYKYGETMSAEFSTSCNIKIKDNNYDNFVKYVADLKKEGFKFLSAANVPENISLSDGTAHWRCTNGKIYLQLIFSEDGTESYDMFGCNLQIFGYSEKPENW